MEKEQNAILEAIDIIVKKRLRNLGFDYYVDGVITSVDISHNVYTVLINGVEYTNIPSKHKLIYSLNDTVQVLIKNGNWKNKFIDDTSYHNRYLSSTQYNSIDGTGTEFPLICHNDTNIWIGARRTASRHHSGKNGYGRTYISAGYDDDNKKGHETVYISVPNNDNNNGANYKVMHNGNLIDYVYPIGSICIRETKSDPVNTLGGTWTLVDKEFTTLVENFSEDNTYFTPNTNVIAGSQLRIIRTGHNLNTKVFLTLAEGATLTDSSQTLGTFNLKALGISRFPVDRSFPVGYTDGGNAIIMGYLYGDTGKLNVIDVVKRYVEGDENNNTVSGTSVYFDFTETITSSIMLDEACSKFYWKRKA